MKVEVDGQPAHALLCFGFATINKLLWILTLSATLLLAPTEKCNHNLL